MSYGPRPPLTALLAALLAIVAPAHGRAAPDAQAANLQVTITGVEGMVQVRDGEGKPWRKAQAGMVVGAGAEFRTGPKSAVRCQIPPDQTFTIDRLGVMKVLTALRQKDKVKTELAMPYGRTRYDIEEAGLEHEASIRSPSSTLAIRGTRVSLYDQPPFTPRATSLTGRAVYSNAKRQVAFGGKGAGTNTVQSGQSSAAENAANIAVVERVIDPRSDIEFTQAETQQLAFEVTQGGIRFDRLIVGGFRPPPDDLAAAGLLPGKLNFVATFDGFTDIDLFVITPDDRVIGNPSIADLFNSSPSSARRGRGKAADSSLSSVVSSRLPGGGRIDFDKVSTGKGDFEICYWPGATFKPGVYGIGVVHNDFRALDPDYDPVSNVKIEVYLDGRKLNTVVTNPDAARPVLGTTYRTQTNLNTGRDVVTTAAVIPDPNATPSRASAKAPKAAPAPPPPPPPKAPAKRAR